MSDDSLPTEYDAIVLGTGMTECIIAAALSRIGQRVLHLDRNDYYSGDWGTFHFEGLQNWIHRQQGSASGKLAVKTPEESLLQEGESEVQLQVDSTTISAVNEHVYVPEELPVSKVPSENQALAREDEGTTSAEEGKPSTKDDGSVKEEHEGGSIQSEDDIEKSSDNEHESSSKENDTGVEGEKLPPAEEETKPTEEVSDGVDVGSDVNKEEVKPKKQWSFSEIKKQWRKFNIDLQPKILYCRGSMVELLISSDIAKYCEFKSITRVLTYLDSQLQQVPCSRADVFSSRQVSMIEKRMLMKLLTFAVEYEKHPEQYEGFEDKTFDEFLVSRKLTKNVQHYVRSAIAMATNKTSALDGLKSTQKFLQSLGRYGNTAFLWPLYGSGELPQCFCRMCAVFGGIYCLRRTAVSLIVDKDKKCQGIIDTDGQRLNSKWVILESSYASKEMYPQAPKRSISRGIFIVDRSLQTSETEHISLLTLPPGEGQDSPITVIELAPMSMACPKDTYVVHMTCNGSGAPEEDLKSAAAQLFQPTDGEEQADDNRPLVLWSVFFSQEDTTSLTLNDHGLKDVFVVGTPDCQLDFDHAIEEARGIFETLCPGEEFLPRAPNPEDIIYDDDQQGPNTEGSGFEPSQSGEADDFEKDKAGAEKEKEILEKTDAGSTDTTAPAPPADEKEQNLSQSEISRDGEEGVENKVKETETTSVSET